jgi:hypothetical protein
VLVLAPSTSYTNQYMVLDLNRFTPGQPLPPNTLWVGEQIPGDYVAEDQTQKLALGCALLLVLMSLLVLLLVAADGVASAAPAAVAAAAAAVEAAAAVACVAAFVTDRGGKMFTWRVAVSLTLVSMPVAQVAF